MSFDTPRESLPPAPRSCEVAEFDPARRAGRALVKLADTIESISTMRATISVGTPETGGDILRCWNPHREHHTLDVVCETGTAQWPNARPSFLLEPEGEVLAAFDQPAVAAKKLITRLGVRL